MKSQSMTYQTCLWRIYFKVNVEYRIFFMNDQYKKTNSMQLKFHSLAPSEKTLCPRIQFTNCTMLHYKSYKTITDLPSLKKLFKPQLYLTLKHIQHTV